jgi:alpha-glucosidase
LGAFYPLMRLHNSIDEEDKELYIWGDDVIKIGIKYINLRYSLNSYYYSLFFDSHVNGGSGFFYFFNFFFNIF